jgi:hemolysin activation/secretion protein
MGSMGRAGNSVLGLVLALASLVGAAAWAQTDREALERSEQERARRQQREATAMAPVTAPQVVLADWQPPVAKESPCFTVHLVVWADPSRPELAGFGWLLQGLKGYEGECLGAQSLQRLRANLDARLLVAGYVTSRLLIPAQSLADGLLRVELQLGRIGRIVHRAADGSPRVVPSGWLPQQAGDVLNLRDLEQGLENAARLPSLAAQIAIEPGDEQGLSNVVLLHADAPRWRARAQVDDQGLRDFGRLQLSASAVADLGWLGADQLQLWHQRSASSGNLRWRSSLSYSSALGAQLFSLNLGQGAHRRAVQGTTLLFTERARDHSVQAQLQRVLMRRGGWRLSGLLAVSGRQSRSFIEDTELLLQRRRSSEWSWGLDSQVRGADTQLSLQLQRQRTLVNDPRVEQLPQELSLPQQDSVELEIGRAIRSGRTAVQYAARASLQWVRNPAFGADLRSLGGPGTVRGFDGSRQLVGLQSRLLRQDLLIAPALWQTGDWRAQLSLALDVGQVAGLGPEPARDRLLAGAQAGLRIQTSPRWSLELSLGRPLLQPADWGRKPRLFSAQLAAFI